MNIHYELVNGYDVRGVPADVVAEVLRSMNLDPKGYFPLTSVMCRIAKRMNAEGCRAYGITDNTSDILRREYLGEYNAPMETHLWHLPKFDFGDWMNGCG